MGAKKFFAALVLLVMTAGIYGLGTAPVQASGGQVGTVDAVNGVWMRAEPNEKATKIALLKRSDKVNVISQENTDWYVTEFNGKEAFIPASALRFYKTTSQGSVKQVTDRIISLQRDTWKGNMSKEAVYKKMQPGFDKAYIDHYFAEHMRPDGKKNGMQMYHIKETEIYGYAISELNWNKEGNGKPTYQFYLKDGKEYLSVSQSNVNEESGNDTMTLSLQKEPGSTWKAYGINRVYK
ncbi:SH3 domain-containing protein [Bacillus testis]|uniref:SH3 domain-containing protein n=1 Tax=Bacillus testis TaxID=1622072 RepID=UPI00067EC63F|nr:SH3 domain-containing protein [Bacillus testis]